jgi:DNA mismatch endonuclease (patch repair protein)
VPQISYATDPRTSARMSRISPSGTRPELLIRRILRSIGVRYALNRMDLPGRPDIVVPSQGLAIFVHGCFWHRHSCRRGRSEPLRNRNLWMEKLERNATRDRANVRALHRIGWRVLTIWECQLKAPRTSRRLERALSVLR